jgi:hypothetical protein
MNSTHNMDNPQTEQPPTMSNTKFPKKEQTIILAVTADLKLVDYVRPIANIVGAKHIIFASRISNNRICIYLDSVELVDSLIAQYKSVQINEYEVNIRRLITPSQRIILSNVCPSIPNEVLINEIKRIGYTTLSPMTHLRAGIWDEELTHILSFKRQIFVQPNDTITLPSSLVIKFEDTNYRIFFSNDLICYLCKVQGHIASQCTAPPTQQDNVPEINPDTNKENQQDIVQNNMDCEDEDTRKGIEKMIGQKRAATSSSASVPHDSTENDLGETTVFKRPQQQKKRLKKDAYAEQMKSSDDKLQTIHTFMNNLTEPIKIEASKIVHFFRNASGCKDPLALVEEFTDDIDHFLDLLAKLHSHFKDKGMKQRCTKYRNRIAKQCIHRKQPLTEVSDTEESCTDSSLSSLN